MNINESQRIQLLANQLQSFLILVDSFVENLTDEDYKLLEKSKHTLQANINLKQSAATLAIAFGIEQDTIEEKYKIKTIDAILNLFEVRKTYFKYMIEKDLSNQKKAKNKSELMKLFGMID